MSGPITPEKWRNEVDVRDVVEIINGPHAGMIGRVRSITNGKARIVFSSTDRSVLVSVSYLRVSP